MPKLSPSVLLYVLEQQGMYVVSNEALLTHSWRHVTRRQNTKQEDKGVHNMEGMTWVRIGMRHMIMILLSVTQAYLCKRERGVCNVTNH